MALRSTQFETDPPLPPLFEDPEANINFIQQHDHNDEWCSIHDNKLKIKGLIERGFRGPNLSLLCEAITLCKKLDTKHIDGELVDLVAGAEACLECMA